MEDIILRIYFWYFSFYGGIKKKNLIISRFFKRLVDKSVVAQGSTIVGAISVGKRAGVGRLDIRRAVRPDVAGRCNRGQVANGPGGNKWCLWVGNSVVAGGNKGGRDVVHGLDLGGEVLEGGGGKAGPESELVSDVVVGQDAAVGEGVAEDGRIIIK